MAETHAVSQTVYTGPHENSYHLRDSIHCERYKRVSSACLYTSIVNGLTLLQLIQVRVEDKQRWWHMQNPTQSPSQYTLDPMRIISSKRQHPL